MTALRQHDIGMSIAVEVANAGVGGCFRNGLQRNNFKRTQAAGLKRFHRRLTSQRRQSIRMKHYEPGCGKRRQDKCAIQKSGPHVACESEWPTEKLQVGSQGTFPVLLVSLLTPLGFFCQPLGNSLF